MNDNFQNPLQILKAKCQESWSGCIEIEEPKNSSVSWHIYLLQGKIQYVGTTVGQQTRLNYLWQRFKLGSNCPALLEDLKVSEYSQLCQCLSDKQLTEPNIKKLLFMFTAEGLTHVLSINQTNIELKPAKRINKSLVSFELEKYYGQIKEQIETWREVRSYLFSPLSRLYLDQKNALKFYKIWKELYTRPELAPLTKSQPLSTFVSLFVAKNNLYQIATKTQVDTYFLIKSLRQSLEEKIIYLLPFSDEANLNNKTNNIAPLKDNITNNDTNSASYQLSEANQNTSPTLIACIDDSKTVQRQVKMTLEAAGYQVLGIVDPTMALKNLSQHQPKVIFLDINMPNINGYDLCSLLRKSQKFKEIPIVMLTGRDGMIDRVRAKLVGATDYLTKPCDPNKLIQLAKVLEKSVITVS
jgi:twitching motility two-component system response regulator PilG